MLESVSANIRKAIVINRDVLLALRHWANASLVFYGIAYTPQVIQMLIRVASGGTLDAPAPVESTTQILYYIGALWASACLMIAYDSMKSGESAPGQPQIMRRALRRLPSITLSWLVTIVVIGLGLLLFVIPGIIAAVRLATTCVHAVVDEKGPIEAMRMSWRQSRGSFGELSLALSVAAILSVLYALLMLAMFVAVVYIAGRGESTSNLMTIQHPDIVAAAIIYGFLSLWVVSVFWTLLLLIVRHAQSEDGLGPGSASRTSASTSLSA